MTDTRKRNVINLSKQLYTRLLRVRNHLVVAEDLPKLTVEELLEAYVVQLEDKLGITPPATDKETTMTNRATSTYYVKNTNEKGQPTIYQTGSKQAAARHHAGRNPLPEWTFEVWTEAEYRNGKGAATFTADEL